LLNVHALHALINLKLQNEMSNLFLYCIKRNFVAFSISHRANLVHFSWNGQHVVRLSAGIKLWLLLHHRDKKEVTNKKILEWKYSVFFGDFWVAPRF